MANQGGGGWTFGKILALLIALILLLLAGTFGVSLVLSGMGAEAPHESPPFPGETDEDA